MTGLVLKLAPNERVLINGAVIENGNRRGRLNIVTPGANILRLRDAIHPGEANTPVRRLCYAAQLILSGDISMADARAELGAGILQLGAAMNDPESTKIVRAAFKAIEDNQPYYVLKSLRQLLPREEYLLSIAKRPPSPDAIAAQ
ncbi:flagellar protein FlbT [Palleronia aestuarii]|uniref:Flagellar protein FlbT n=1 Tax=Palleronia aestuarii TaxID=568105 RepID=A0A2W7NAG0_9RHOB|nr:flagellar biosynthesis repressor FlbT [Palleronia aestuarii]PZX15067.1 flagellar protein FlbT [Palleronia aestuarii]